MDNELLKKRVKGEVHFVTFVYPQLFYRTDDNFEFSIELEDAKEAVFSAKDKGIFYMRWIRKQMELNEKAREDQEAQQNLV